MLTLGLKILSLWRGGKDNPGGLLLKQYPIISCFHSFIQSHASHCHILLASAQPIHSFHKTTKIVYLLTAGTESKCCSYYMCSCTFTCTLSSSHSGCSIMVCSFHIWVFSLSYKERKSTSPTPFTVPDFSMMLLHGPSTLLLCFECFATYCVLHLFVGM